MKSDRGTLPSLLTLAELELAVEPVSLLVLSDPLSLPLSALSVSAPDRRGPSVKISEPCAGCGEWGVVGVRVVLVCIYVCVCLGLHAKAS